MRTTLHLVWNDLRRLRWWIALLAVTFVAMDAFGFALLYMDPIPKGGAGDETWMRIVAIRNTLTGVPIILGYVIALLLIQGDSLHGTRGFWLTRPISPVRLCCAKLLSGLILLVGAPVLLSLPWWLWCGFGASELLQAIGMVACVAVVVGVPAAFIAAICDSLARALLWGGLVVPVVAISLYALTLTKIAGFALVSINAGAFLIAAVVILSFVGATALQYFRRFSKFAVVFLGLGLLTAAFLLRRGYLRGPDRWEKEAGLAGNATVRVSSATARPSRSMGNDYVQATLRLFVANLPDGTIVEAGRTAHRWTWPDGFVIERNGWSYDLWQRQYAVREALGMKVPEEDSETRTWIEDRQREFEARSRVRNPALRHSADENRRRGEFAAAVELMPSVAARIATERPAYEGRYDLRLLRPRIMRQVPLQPSRWSAVDAIGMRIIAAEDSPSKLSVGFVETRRDRSLLSYRTSSDWDDSNRAYLLVRPDTHEGVVPGVDTGRRIAVNSVEVIWRKCSFAEQVIRDGKWVAPERPWHDGAQLVCFISDEVARFERTIQVPKFAFGPIGPDAADPAVP